MSDANTCLICGSREQTVLHECSDYLSSGETFSIGECTQCGFRFTLSPPSELKIGDYYLSEDYISHSDTKRGLTERLYHLARRIMLRKKLRLVNRVNGLNKGVLLDIGCGTGYFPSYMKEHGWQATGIEINEKARNYAISKFGLNVISPEEVDSIQTNSFDCITLWHVMEHFHNPELWFSTIDKMLKKEGKCIIALPNSASSDAKWFKKYWAAWDVPRHLWHFSPDSFRKFADRCGYEITETYGMPFDGFYISILSYKNKKSMLALPIGLLCGFFFFVSTLFNKEKSSSIIYVLEKKS